MLEPPQMLARSKPWLALAGIVIVSTAALAWSFTRLHPTEKIERVPASGKRGSGSGSLSREPNSPSS
ncbi:MAG TPA: hypothetical protein VFH91_01490, partial [Pyrinomonadaceae bacterium]|nr:hypothetical protein [Pyrinomonadaceae bacterium]